jgi:hypothetical protein
MPTQMHLEIMTHSLKRKRRHLQIYLPMLIPRLMEIDLHFHLHYHSLMRTHSGKVRHSPMLILRLNLKQILMQNPRLIPRPIQKQTEMHFQKHYLI